MRLREHLLLAGVHDTVGARGARKVAMAHHVHPTVLERRLWRLLLLRRLRLLCRVLVHSEIGIRIGEHVVGLLILLVG